MQQRTLTVLDTTGIQDYIFGSNRLSENIGASHLVELATHAWVQAALPAPHNLDRQGDILADFALENHADNRAEVVYRGGGNVVILFRTIEDARQMVAHLSQRLLLDAPGMEIAVAHQPFDWATEPLGGADGVYNRMMRHLAQSKQQQRISAPLLGQGVSLACRATGLPAVGYDRQEPTTPRPVAAPVLAKIAEQTRQQARDRLKQFLPPEAQEPRYTLSDDLDHLGRSREQSSYIAVVHADGNSMGQRFEDLIEKFSDTAQNRDCLNALRDLSLRVEAAGRAALTTTVQRMVAAFATSEQTQVNDELRLFLAGLSQIDAMPVLPFRPIVFGGDDVTFVCDGRLGLPLAALYLEEFERAARQHMPEMDVPVHACAGIAIVKAHYPFARAYTLSEALCKNAKRAVKDHCMTDTSALDWHFATAGITGSIGAIRQREYLIQEGATRKRLDMRPISLRPPGMERSWRNWETFLGVVDHFKRNAANRRNKIMALREVLREGGVATQRFLQTYALSTLLPDLGAPALQTTGWDDRCGYFDAIEALDFCLPLSHGKED